MIFNSVEFLVFFPAVCLVYFSVVKEHRWIVLLLASYYFYMSWEPFYAILILLSTAVDYYAGLGIGRTENPHRKKWLLTASVITNLGILFTFKYYGFFTRNLESVTAYFGLPMSFPSLEVLLPIGISFYTFQSMSYTIDVYRGKKEPEEHLGIFALYVSFFPQLVAGPVERSTRLLPQLHEEVNFEYSRVTNGLKLAAWGLFQKVVIADRLRILVDDVYSTPDQFENSMVVIATYFIPLQVLCDFQGYTNIAQGTAKIFGISLMENFRQPFFAKSTPEFWARYHISVTSWFRDYLYIPLGGNNLNSIAWAGNIFLLFVTIGVWHGANWTWFLFGVFHAVVYLIYRWCISTEIEFQGPLRTVFNLFSVVFCFHILAVSSIAYRAESLGLVWSITRKLPVGFFNLLSGFSTTNFWSSLSWDLTTMSPVNFVLSLVLILFFLFLEWVETRDGLWKTLHRQNLVVRWSFYYLLVAGVFFLGVWKQYEFIYFQF